MCFQIRVQYEKLHGKSIHRLDKLKPLYFCKLDHHDIDDLDFVPFDTSKNGDLPQSQTKIPVDEKPN